MLFVPVPVLVPGFGFVSVALREGDGSLTTISSFPLPLLQPLLQPTAPRLRGKRGKVIVFASGLP